MRECPARLLARLELGPARTRRVVLWGGRPGFDLQFGEPADLKRAAVLRHFAAMRQATTAMSRSLAVLGESAHVATAKIGRAFAAIGANAQTVLRANALAQREGITFDEAARRMRQAGEEAKR